MNTPRILVKLSSFIILISLLLIEITIFCYGEETIKSRNFHKTDENMLFTFMRANYKLEAYAAAIGIDIAKGDDEILASLPYRGLYRKLQKKLLDLAVAESRNAISNNDITEEMSKAMNTLITEASGGFDQAVLAFRKKFKDYPNTSDLVSLIAMSLHDAIEISELSAASKEGNATTKEADKEFFKTMFDDAVHNYKAFVKTNVDALNILSRLADAGFKFEELTVKCKPFAGREQCETEKSINEIKNFSEIMPYLINLQDKEIIKDPSISFIPGTDF